MEIISIIFYKEKSFIIDESEQILRHIVDVIVSNKTIATMIEWHEFVKILFYCL